uniref:Uncharacterized protein n=1 Tax=Clastoptera arizonana TaxID=38151 RepID=A0A1B6E158_9HEMI
MDSITSYENMTKEYLQIHKSLHNNCPSHSLKTSSSKKEVTLRFWNGSKEHFVMVCSISDIGSLNLLNFIEMENCYTQSQVFISECFVFIDPVTGDRLLGNNKCIYRAESEIDVDSFDYNKVIQVHIQSPLYSLRNLSLRVIRDSCEDDDDVSDLNVPISIQNDLKKCIEAQDIIRQSVNWQVEQLHKILNADLYFYYGKPCDMAF